ncbi:MAG: phage tail assembly protein [Cyanobacteria bacterium J06560_2]
MLPRTFDFTLPKGFVDEQGAVHRHGTMRLATAIDEIDVQQDARARQNPGYALLIMLSRVITRLGDLEAVSAQQLEGLFTPDISYLRLFYEQTNQQGLPQLGVACPQCAHEFQVELSMGKD